jgi:hypothetical protein
MLPDCRFAAHIDRKMHLLNFLTSRQGGKPFAALPLTFTS